MEEKKKNFRTINTIIGITFAGTTIFLLAQNSKLRGENKSLNEALKRAGREIERAWYHLGRKVSESFK